MTTPTNARALAAEGRTMSKATKPTDAPPRHDHRVVARDPFLSVFVDADGGVVVHASASGVSTSIIVAAEHAAAFIAAVSTPYSGGTAQ